MYQLHTRNFKYRDLSMDKIITDAHTLLQREEYATIVLLLFNSYQIDTKLP